MELHKSLLGFWTPSRVLHLHEATQVEELCKLLNGMQRHQQEEAARVEMTRPHKAGQHNEVLAPYADYFPTRQKALDFLNRRAGDSAPRTAKAHLLLVLSAFRSCHIRLDDALSSLASYERKLAEHIRLKEIRG